MPAGLEPQEESGFALVDVLVGLVVMGLIGAVLTSVLSLAVWQHEHAAEAQRIKETSLGISRLLNGLAEGAVLVRDDSAGWRSAYGNTGELVVTSLGLPILALDAPVRFILTTEKNPKGYDLLISWKDTSSGQERSEIVLAHAQDIAFSYLIARERRWVSETGLGTGRIGAIRLTIRVAKNAPAIDIVAPLPARLPASCVADRDNPGCKGRFL